MIHVYSHTGGEDWTSKWNDEADKLAKTGADLHGQHYNWSISDLFSNGPVHMYIGWLFQVAHTYGNTYQLAT